MERFQRLMCGYKRANRECSGEVRITRAVERTDTALSHGTATHLLNVSWRPSSKELQDEENL